ncbi:MAG: hypothetical protein EBX50_16160 [Chitinophagia bacterium]|nr:hypothetical protein [Chitinophagia bacterium]
MAFIFVFVALMFLARARQTTISSIVDGKVWLDAMVYNGSIILLNLFLGYAFGLKSSANWLALFILSLLIVVDLAIRPFHPWLYSKDFQFIRITVGNLREFVSIIPVLPVLFLGFQSGYLKR